MHASPLWAFVWLVERTNLLYTKTTSFFMFGWKCMHHLVYVWIELKSVFSWRFSMDLVHYSRGLQVLYSTKKTLKLVPTILFIHLKIILLQYFQFSSCNWWNFQSHQYSFSLSYIFKRWNYIILIITTVDVNINHNYLLSILLWCCQGYCSTNNWYFLVFLMEISRIKTYHFRLLE